MMMMLMMMAVTWGRRKAKWRRSEELQFRLGSTLYCMRVCSTQIHTHTCRSLAELFRANLLERSVCECVQLVRCFLRCIVHYATLHKRMRLLTANKGRFCCCCCCIALERTQASSECFGVCTRGKAHGEHHASHALWCVLFEGVEIKEPTTITTTTTTAEAEATTTKAILNWIWFDASLVCSLSFSLFFSRFDGVWWSHCCCCCLFCIVVSVLLGCSFMAGETQAN